MRRLQIKFPSQIRISGWDFGSSARAMNQAGGKDSLMTYENESIPQAEGAKYASLTFERKTMSTKTSIKRIALVAVSALGFGMVSTIAANAAVVEESNGVVTAVALTTPGTGRLGSIFTTPVKLTVATATADHFVTLRARFDSVPTGSTAVVGFSKTTNALVDTTAGGATLTTNTVSASNAAGNELLPAAMKIAPASIKAIADVTAGVAGAVGFTPDLVGTYKVTVWQDANGNGLVDTAEATTGSISFTVGAAPTTVSVSSVSGTGIVGSDALIKVSLLDAAGAAAGLASNEAIVLTPGDATTDWTTVNGSNAHAVADGAISLVASDFVKGVSYITFNNDTAAGGTDTITISGTGGSVTAVSGTFTQKFVPSAAPTAGSTIVTKSDGTTAGTYGVASNVGVAGSITAIKIPAASKTITYLTTVTAGIAAAATDQYTGVTITDVSGYTTGSASLAIAGLVYTKAVALTAPSTTSTTYTGNFTISTTAPTAANQYSASVNDDDGTATAGDALDTDTAIAVASQAININGLSSVTVTPSAALSLKIGSTVSYTVKVVDQFGVALPNASVLMTAGTRNAIAVAKSAITDANGYASFSITDAPASGVTSLTDTFTFTASWNGAASAGTNSGAITWSATGPVPSTVTILGGNNTTTGVAATSNQWVDINAGVSGASATTSAITATVKDAAGNLLAGVPVVFTVAGTGAAIPSNKVTAYTAADGTASSTVYAWLKGTYVVTATALGVAGTSTYAFRQSGSGEERVISVTAEGNLVTAKVVDRFGNPVPSVTVYATKTGAGYFGTGTIKTNTTTDNDGLAQFLVTGSATVTVSTYDAATAVAPLGSGQSCARAGASDCNLLAADDTAFTAYAAGTVSKAEVGVGSDKSAAGVSSASVDVNGSEASDAVDAANEATDAANAATDAANAAAEAADAATAAAQDAQAAVAALATQVASLIAGIKAQITTLTNLVIKIQKKVRA